jgi:hypothetical protein
MHKKLFLVGLTLALTLGLTMTVSPVADKELKALSASLKELAKKLPKAKKTPPPIPPRTGKSHKGLAKKNPPPPPKEPSKESSGGLLDAIKKGKILKPVTKVEKKPEKKKLSPMEEIAAKMKKMSEGTQDPEEEETAEPSSDNPDDW